MAKKEKKDKKQVGRPTVVSESVLQKLQIAFSIGCTDAEACLYANIAEATLYNYCNKKPEFLEQKELWKKKPILKAKFTIFNGLEKDLPTARWYLERKCKDEFSQRTEMVHNDFHIEINRQVADVEGDD